MKEKVCNLWFEPAEYRCVPTIGAITAEGTAVLATNLAKEAAGRYQGFEIDLGRVLAARGNHVNVVRPGLLCFPIKQYEWTPPSLQIIERSARELCTLVGEAKTLLPRPGCGEGELSWDEVSKVLAFLPDNVIVIQHA